MTENRSGGEFLVGLHKKGLLPGDSKNSHGEMVSDRFTLPSSQAKDVDYPFSQTFHWNVLGETFTNNYTVVRTSKESAWQLQKAWRTDSAGQVVEEWPVK